MLSYCNKCKEKYGLNERSFQLFGKKCEICNCLSTVNVCTITKMENNKIYFQTFETVEVNGRKQQQAKNNTVDI
jgi:hypothetical protein